jgi:hypothetical protein
MGVSEPWARQRGPICTLQTYLLDLDKLLHVITTGERLGIEFLGAQREREPQVSVGTSLDDRAQIGLQTHLP